jgi:hypothetical protein
MEKLMGPERRYEIRLELLTSNDGRFFTRHWTDEGEPVGMNGTSLFYLATWDDLCSITVGLGENGLLLRSIRLSGVREVELKAWVYPGPGASESLPQESTCLLFAGDPEEARSIRERYIPFDGLIQEQIRGQGVTPLDRLAIAVGRSVARANAALAGGRGPGGVALVSSVTFRVAVDQAELEKGRVIVTLSRPGESAGAQFVEFSMTTVPEAEREET